MRQTFAIIIVGLLLLSSAPALAQSPSVQSLSVKDEVITIDGSKNPEMIPQWSAWRTAFNFINISTTHVGASGLRGEDAMPTVFFRGPSHDERLVIMKESQDAMARYTECTDRGLKIRDQLLADGIATPERVQRAKDVLSDANMECRRVTLGSRDRLLPKLSADTQTVLQQFVEHLKEGTVIEVAKADLAKFRLPE